MSIFRDSYNKHINELVAKQSTVIGNELAIIKMKLEAAIKAFTK